VSVWLAHQIGGLLEELRTAVVNTLIAEFHDRTRPFDQGQETMFREIRRARNFRHPVALMAVSPTDQSVELSFDRLSRDVQRETVQSYLTAQIGALLSEETKDCDIVTRRNGHFLALLPQTDRQSARQLMERLKAVSKERLGLDLRIGLSTFPDEEVTLVSLMDRAETNLNRDSAHQFAQEPARGSR
jgi:GGDEF domain-containing protein